MSTNKCKNCGCDDTFLPSPAPCPEPAECEEVGQCSEVVDSKCTRYTADDLSCGNNIIVPKDSFIEDALKNIVTLICANTTNKFVKEWVSLVTTGAGTPITITQAELTACYGLRDGCFIPNGITPLQDKCDFVIDIYKYEFGSGTWTRMTAEATTDISINGTTGDITATLSSGLTYDKVRIVVIG
jgi:hypothetical protein